MLVTDAVFAPALVRRYDRDAENYFGRLPDALTLAQRLKFNDLAVALKGADLWAKARCLPLLKNVSEAAAMIDFRFPDRLFTNNGATFVANSYMAGNGSSAWIDLGLNGTAMGLALNSATYGGNVIGGTNAASTTGILISTTNSGATRVIPRFTSDVFLANIHSTTASNVGNSITNIVGRWIATRTGATALKGYKNGVAAAADNDASTSIPSGNLCLFRHTTNYSDFQLTDAFVLDGVTDADAAALDAALAAYAA